MKITKDNSCYIKALKRESEFWEGTNTMYQEELKEVVEYEQLNRFGDKNLNMLDFYKTLGIFDNVLSIGSGDGSFEFMLLKEGFIKNITFIDISPKAVELLEKKAIEFGLKNRVNTKILDLNFIKLEENKYDLICCLNVLHHVINLEECLFELNKSLNKDGILLIDDFIGEKKMLWDDTKIKYIDFFNSFIYKKYSIKLNSITRTNSKVLTNNCPFECIRSDELFDIINYYNGECIIRESLYGYVYNFYQFLGDKVNSNILDDLNKFEDNLKTLNAVKPCRIFGLYKKSYKSILKSQKRNDKEIKENIGLGLINEKQILKLGEKIRKKNYKLYEFMKKVYFIIRK